MGGCLELYEKGSATPIRSIVPTWGTCVVFRTDDRSVHGFSKPIVEGKWRRSIALYYYTSEEPADFSGDETTHWQAHGRQTGTRRVRLWLYKLFLRGSRVYSRLAHQVNPNLGEVLRPKVGLLFGGAIGLLAGVLAGGTGVLMGGAPAAITPCEMLLAGMLVGAFLGACWGYLGARSANGNRAAD